MKNTDQEFKRLIYELMNGSLDLQKYPVKESEFVEDEFAEGKYCDKAYEEIYEANRRVCRRLGVEEDKDVEIIISNFFGITEYLCMKMYDYGMLFNKTEKD